MFSCSFFPVITHITVINNNINDNEGVPAPLNTNQGAPNQQPEGRLPTTRGPWDPNSPGPLTDNLGAPGP